MDSEVETAEGAVQQQEVLASELGQVSLDVKANITTLIPNSVDVNDIPRLLGAITETLLPAMYSLLTSKWAHIVDIQATNDLTKMIVKLQKQMERDNQQQDLFLLLVMLRVLKFEPEKKVFLVRVSKESLEKFTTNFEVLHQEYLYQQGVGDVETFAFLISCLVNSIAEEEDESIRQRDFQQIYCRIQNLLSDDMASFMNQNMVTPQYRWGIIRSTMDDLKKSNKAVLDKTSVDIPDLNNIFGSNSQTNTTNKTLEKPDSASIVKFDQNEKAKNLLDKLGLTKYYPSKISLQDVMAVGDKPDCSTEAMPWIILQKLIMLDYNGYDNELMNYSKTAKNDNTEGTERDEEDLTFESLMKDCVSTGAADNSLNPPDVFLALFSCCDLILKQTLVYKMFMCRLAVPFLSPQLSDKSLQFSLWALRSIIIEWKGQDKKLLETSVVRQPLKTVSFIRLGKPSCSKSILLNHVLTDQSHHTFWNRECPLGDTQRQVADGLVECQWFLPSGKETDAFTDVTMFLNLRGDASDHRKQVNFLKQFSNVIVCFLESSELEKPNILQMVKQLHRSSVILVLTVKDLESLNQQRLKKQCETYMKYVGISNTANANVLFAFKGNRDKSIGDLKQEIRKAANKLLTKQKGRVIEDALKIQCLQNLGDGISIDEEDKSCKTAKQLAQEVIECMGDKPTHICKTTMLPLQGVPLQKWSQLLKETERSGRRKHKSNGVSETAGTKKEQMTALRLEQLNHFKSLSGLMKTFLKNLNQVVDSPTADLFLQWLKIYMDEKCRDTMLGLWGEFQEKWARLKSFKGEGVPQNTAMLKAELVEAQKKLVDAPLGLEHLLREVAQIYEAAVESEKRLNKETEDSIHRLPAVAAKLLLNGQPIEIMDGDTANVPLTWVKAVFGSLKDLVGDKRLYVISALGIQSSDKSTLLNTMFGLQSAVSGGSCTRGAFMQLIKVQQARSDYDFVLVVDYEGFRAPELGHSKHIHDNELATFVIGLGDVTIINIKGENMAEMSDILQIVVHAFLRMKLVNSHFQLHRNCVFIHQNAPAVNAKGKAQHDCQKLQESLDQMTVQACAMENIADIQSFNQVIGFDINKHVWYFSDLWHGDPPMAPVNHGYTEKVQEVKDCILNNISKKLSFLRLTDMILRIEDIWGRVLSDDFVFSFKNSLAAKAYNYLESTYSKLTRKVENDVMLWLNKVIVQLGGFLTCDELEGHSAHLLLELKDNVCGLTKEAKQTLEKLFTSDLKDILIEWKAETMTSLSRESTKIQTRAESDILQTTESRMVDLVQRVEQTNQEKKILQKAQELADATRGKKVDDQELLDKFNNVWIQWLDELTIRPSTVQKVCIANTVEQLLCKHLNKNGPSLKKELIRIDLSTPLHATMLEGSFPEGKIKEKYLSARTSFGNLVPWNNPESEHRNAAFRVINSILKKIDIYLKDISKRDCPFQEVQATYVITCIIDGIQEHNQHAHSQSNSFTILSNLRVKLAVHASWFAISVFKKMQTDYDEKHSTANKLERYKKTALNLFKNTAKQATNEVIAADLLSDHLEEVVKTIVEKQTPNDVVDVITRNFQHTKYYLILDIMDDLASDVNFEDYMSFIANAKDFSLKWVTDFTNRKFFTADEGNSEYTKIADSHICSTIENIKTSISAAVISSQTMPNISTWCQHFRANLRKFHLLEFDMDTVIKQDVKELKNLERLMVIRLGQIKERLLCAFRNETSESIRWQSTTPYKKIIDRLWGCHAQCPFCGEPCQRTDSNHTSKKVNHRCIQHRPAGVGGQCWSYKSTYRPGQLVIEACNYQVQDVSRRFSCGASSLECRKYGKCSASGENWIYHKYTDYKSYVPNWDIAPSSTMESSKYWMWFMATNKDNLTKFYKVKVPDIPDLWNQITCEQAKDSLRMSYK